MPPVRVSTVLGLAALLLAAPVLAPSVAAQPPLQSNGDAPRDFTAVARPLVGAVVNISSERKIAHSAQSQTPLPPPFDQLVPQAPGGGGDDGDNGDQDNGPSSGRGVALGSGFLIDPAGYVVTNNHVVEDAETITVVLHDQREFRAKLVGRDARTDLALLKIDSPQPLPYVRWGDSDNTEIGEWVLTIGNPFGLGGTVTAGIISATARDIGAGPYDSFLQTDASINRGNSGGPMFNMHGDVIGVNTAIFSPSGGSIGIGFAIPSSLARPIIEQLRSTGEVKRGWLGVAIQPVSRDIADSLGLKDAAGVLVAEVTKGGPADKAGIHVGDILLRYNGQAIDDLHRLPRMVADTKIGTEADVTIMREGHEQTVRTQIAALRPQVAKAEKPPAPVSEPGSLGLVLAPLTPEARTELGMSNADSGVLVRGVDPNGEAADQGIAAGDLVLQVDQHPVTTPQEVRQRLDEARHSHRPSVLLLIRHGDARHFITLPLKAASAG